MERSPLVREAAPRRGRRGAWSAAAAASLLLAGAAYTAATTTAAPRAPALDRSAAAAGGGGVATTDDDATDGHDVKLRVALNESVPMRLHAILHVHGVGAAERGSHLTVRYRPLSEVASGAVAGTRWSAAARVADAALGADDDGGAAAAAAWHLELRLFGLRPRTEYEATPPRGGRG